MSSIKIGEKIKAKRKERNLTQEELANKLFVSKAAVSKWENEESYPDITMLPRIAQLFHITMDELFDYTLEEKPLCIVNEYHFGFSLDVVDRQILVSLKNAKLIKSVTLGRYALILYLMRKISRIYCKNTLSRVYLLTVTVLDEQTEKL